MYEQIKGMENIKEMEIEEVVEFHNHFQTKINNKEMSKTDFKQQFNLSMHELFTYIFDTGNYTTNKGLLVKGTPRKRSKKQNEKLTLTDKEINFLKNLVKQGLEDYRDPTIQEKVAREKKIQQTTYFTQEINEQFNNYCQNHKRFSKSEHILMALLEYMDKYK